MPIKFSVILPTYNCDYIEKSIDSVINQNYKFWELIVIDNNSKNNVLEIIKKKKNNKIKYYNINNGGIIGKSRNLGIKKSKYTWIAFLDSDDFWYQDKLLEIKKKIIKDKSDFFYHNMHIYSPKKKFLKKKLYNNFKSQLKKKFDDLIINGNDIIQSSVVVKKKLIIKVGYISEDINLVTWEDFDLWLKISSITNKFNRINKCLGKYFISENKKEKHSRFINNIKNFIKKYQAPINKIMNKYNLNEIWWIQYAKGLDDYNRGKLNNAKKKLDKIKINNNRIKLNIAYIKFKILLKQILILKKWIKKKNIYL